MIAEALRPASLVRWIPASSWMILIFLLSSRPVLPTPPGISATLAAMAGHLVLYFVLTTLLLFAMGAGREASARELLLAGGLALLYGASDEFHQFFVEGRNASLIDVAIDGVGALLALGAWMLWWRRFAAR